MGSRISIAVTMETRAREAFEIALGLSKAGLPDGSEVTVRYGFGNSSLGGLDAPGLLAEKQVDLAFINPSPITRMALKGRGPYSRKIEIRNLAVFPSWDRVAFAVKRSLGVKSIEELGEKRIPLKLSTRGQGPEGTTDFAIREVLNFHGWSVEDVPRWGGRMDRVPTPQHRNRIEGLKRDEYDAVFDEGIRLWLNEALARDMILLPLDDEVSSHMEQLGFPRVLTPRRVFPGLTEDSPALEFGGWPLFCRADFPEEIAYTVVQAIDQRKNTMPVDGERFDMTKICRDTEEGPMLIPLHPGAEKYYKEKGYL